MLMDSRSTDYKTLCSERLLHSSLMKNIKPAFNFRGGILIGESNTLKKPAGTDTRQHILGEPTFVPNGLNYKKGKQIHERTECISKTKYCSDIS